MQKLFIILALAVSLVGCKDEQAVIGEPAPSLSVFNLQDEPIKLTTTNGRSKLLLFWSLSCGGCIQNMQEIQHLLAENQYKLDVLAINMNSLDTDLIPTLEKYQINLPVARDQLGITAGRYNVVGTPTMFVVDEQGILVATYEGIRTPEQLKRLITSLQ